MFITHKQAEIPLGAYLEDGTSQCWHYIEQTTHCPWFYVKVSRKQGGEAFQSMMLLPSIAALEQLLCEQGTTIWLLDVHLVSPGYLNGSDGWKMEKLIELRETRDDINAGAAYVYSMEAGHSYTENLGYLWFDSRSARVIFSAAAAIPKA